MFITKGHFLSPFIRAYKKEKQLTMLHSIDTDLMAAIRIVGFDQDEQTPVLDLVKIDKVHFVTDQMPSHIQDLIPDGFELVSEEE